jgi:hypothetical protein
MFDRRMTTDDVNDLDFFELEGASLASEKAVFDHAFAPGAERQRTLRPQRDPDHIIDDPQLWDEQEIADSPWTNEPLRDLPVIGRRSAKE